MTRVDGGFRKTVRVALGAASILVVLNLERGLARAGSVIAAEPVAGVSVRQRS